jgi:hypothetical protein
MKELTVAWLPGKHDFWIPIQALHTNSLPTVPIDPTH